MLMRMILGVEHTASTDDEAIDAMCSYLAKRYGPRKVS
jgi:hypothetical protein